MKINRKVLCVCKSYCSLMGWNQTECRTKENKRILCSRKWRHRSKRQWWGGATDISFGWTGSNVWPSSTANDQTDTVAFDGWTNQWSGTIAAGFHQWDEDKSTVNLLRLQLQNHTTSLGFTWIVRPCSWFFTIVIWRSVLCIPRVSSHV